MDCDFDLWPLAPHPACPMAPLVRIQAGVARNDDGRALRLRFRLTADAAARLVIPPVNVSPGPRDGLWQHTCLEAFIGNVQADAYHEFNFSPSGDWAGYAFADTRIRDAAHQPLAAPRAIWTRLANGLQLDAWIDAADLPAHTDTPPRVGLSAVLEHENDAPTAMLAMTTPIPAAAAPTTSTTTLTTLTYWALAHPRSTPDFHDRAGWTVPLRACS